MDKSCPTRSEANGRAEVSIKNFRNFFEKYLIHLGLKNARTRWSDFTSMCLCLYNSSILYSSQGGKTSRARTFFGSRFLSSKFAIENGEIEDFEKLVESSRQFNSSMRTRNKMKYRDPLSDLFEQNQTVLRILAKSELPAKDGGRSLPPSRVAAPCRVLSKGQASMRVLELNGSGRIRTFPYHVFRPLSSKNSALYSIPLSASIKDHFSQGLVNPGASETLLQKVLDSKEFVQSQVNEAKARDRDFVEGYDKKVDELVKEDLGAGADDHELAQLEDKEKEEETVEEIPPAAEEEEEAENPTGYYLRPRRKVYSTEISPRIQFNRKVAVTTFPIDGSARDYGKFYREPLRFKARKPVTIQTLSQVAVNALNLQPAFDEKLTK